MSKRVLLTGGLGFIGSHTVEHWLKNTDWDIVVMDALRFSGRIERLTDMDGYDPKRVEVVWHDLRSPVHSQLIEKLGDIDYIVNMASDSHVDRSITHPVDFVQNNVNLVLNMLEYARYVEPEKFIQVSTDEVYGPAPLGHDHVEGEPHRPSNPYSASKAAQEAIAYSYWRTYGVPITITNTMNNFGERQHPEKYVPMVIRRIVNNETIHVHGRPGDGDEWAWDIGSRVWLHARNHADAVQYLLENVDPIMYSDAEFTPDIQRFNVAGEQEINNLEIVKMIGDILNTTPKYEMVDYHTSRPGHDLRYSLDGSKLKEHGWTAPIGLEESFKRTVLWTMAHKEWLTE
jgi:dTDP-glucose 4,6-dehydratase